MAFYEVIQPCDVVIEEPRPGKEPIRRRFAVHTGNLRAIDDKFVCQVPEAKGDSFKTVPTKDYLREVDPKTKVRPQPHGGYVKRLPTGAVKVCEPTSQMPTLEEKKRSA